MTCGRLFADDLRRADRPPRRAARWRSCRAGRCLRCRACRCRGSRACATTRSPARARSRRARPCAARTSPRANPGARPRGSRCRPLHHPCSTRATLCTPSAAYFAVVPAPFDASSSGWAWTWRRRQSFRGHPEHATCCVRAQRPRPSPMLRTCWAALRNPTDVGARRPDSARRRRSAGHQYLARLRELGEPAREIDDRPEVVAVARDHGPGRESDPQRGQPFRPGRVAERERRRDGLVG